MSGRMLIPLLLLAGCGRATPTVTSPAAMPTAETQLTTAPHGHILTNTAVWSPDSEWIVYDVRSDPAGSVFDGTRIERVNVKTKRVEVLYESKNGAFVGVATVNPVDGRVVFIHGPEHPTPDWSYSACHREGVIVDPAKPGVAVPLEARDVVPPFTYGALRGGTHVHTWDDSGSRVSFTYEDHVLTHGRGDHREPNRRTIGQARQDQRPVRVPKTHPRNHDGTYFSEITVRTHPSPNPGDGYLSKAFEDAWIPNSLRQTFIGEVIAADGRRVNELCVTYRATCILGIDPLSNPGTETTMPLPCPEDDWVCITRFSKIPGHHGLSTAPRHWPRTSPDQKKVALLTEDGKLHVFDDPITEAPKILFGGIESATPPRFIPLRFLSDDNHRIASAFTWHPNSQHLAAVVDKSVCLINVDSGKVTPLTTPSDPPPRPEACVVSPDGSKVAFVRQVGGFNQVFVVDVPPEVVK